MVSLVPSILVVAAAMIATAVYVVVTRLRGGKPPTYSRPAPLGWVTPIKGGSMPASTSRAAELAALKARQAQEVADFLADNPSAFEVGNTLSAAETVKAVETMTRKHLRRFPKTDCALALSIKALFEGTSTTYQR